MPTLSKARQIFLYVAPFPGLAFFKIWASFEPAPGSLFIGAGLILIYCVGVLVLAWRWDKPTYFDWAVFGYFLALAFALGLWPEATAAILRRYAVTGIYVCLFLAAFVRRSSAWIPSRITTQRNMLPRRFGTPQSSSASIES